MSIDAFYAAPDLPLTPDQFNHSFWRNIRNYAHEQRAIDHPETYPDMDTNQIPNINDTPQARAALNRTFQQSGLMIKTLATINFGIDPHGEPLLHTLTGDPTLCTGGNITEALRSGAEIDALYGPGDLLSSLDRIRNHRQHLQNWNVNTNTIEQLLLANGARTGAQIRASLAGGVQTGV